MQKKLIAVMSAFFIFQSALPKSQSVEMDPDMRMLGGQTTVIMRGHDAFSLPARNATRAHRRSFVIGNSLFKENWVSTPASVKSRQGLGPVHNANSCSTCHFKDGRGAPPENENESFSTMLIRWSVPGKGPHGETLDVPNYGDQLNHRSIVGVKAEGDVKVRFQEEHYTYPDGTKASLVKPHYTFENLAYGPLPEDVQISPRVAPHVVGLGLLEAISEEDILAKADPDDKNSDGISGRPNWVWDRATQKKSLGRFGWKANQPNLAQQNAGAFLGDMGITSKHFSVQNCGAIATDCLKAASLPHVEIDDEDLVHVETYARLLAVPAQRDSRDPIVAQGYKAFVAAQCSTCHTESYRTGSLKGFPELSQQKIFPFTDLLLHDMGEGLADHRPDFAATGSEWRTPPLWGIGLFKEVNGHTRYLHDGRARNLEEAILWHGGEASKSRQLFVEMQKPQRAALIRFLESL